MKNSEKKALYDAFNIPEPERKNTFLPVFEEKSKKNKPSFHLPVIMRYASAALIAVLVIGLFSLTRTSELRNQFRDDPSTSIISEPDITQNGTLPEEQSPEDEYPDDDATGSAPATNPSNDTFQQTDMTEKQSPINTIPVTTSYALPSYSTITQTVTSAVQPSIPIVPLETTVNTQIGTDAEVSITTTASSKPPAASVTTVSTSPPITTTVTSSCEDIAQTTTSTQTGGNNSVTEEGIDYTVYPDVVYSSSGDAVNLDEYFSTDSIFPPAADDSADSLNSMAADSDYIISGWIDEMIYTSANGKPYTVENLTITNIYKSSSKLFPLDRISLFVPGGYMTARDYTDLTGITLQLPDDTVVYDPGGNNGTQNLADEYIFFIKDAGAAFPEGTFKLTENTDISVFKLENNIYTSLGNTSLSFTLAELQDILY